MRSRLVGALTASILARPARLQSASARCTGAGIPPTAAGHAGPRTVGGGRAAPRMLRAQARRLGLLPLGRPPGRGLRRGGARSDRQASRLPELAAGAAASLYI